MPIGLAAATFNIAVAIGCGSLIGIERQFRQRKAGLRTNALVALGAATYMVFSMQIEGDTSPSRVAAQVVSGIGFIGAGIIFRDGFNVHGLTTAATLWCSAAVGLLAGSGQWDFALVTTALVVFVTLGLRPLVQWMKRRIRARAPAGRSFRLMVTVPADQEGDARALLLRTMSLGGLNLTEMLLAPAAGGVELTAAASGEGVTDPMLEQIVHRLAAEPGLIAVRWEPADED